MNFKKETCWSTGEVERVTDPVALGIDDATFAAVHTPIPLTVHRGSARDEDLDFQDYEETELVSDLLSEDTDHQFVLVTGEPGSGKSHLIRWVHTQIPSSDDRHVILIPRARTNLRGVIGRLLEDFDDETFDEYRKRLESATTPPTPAAGRAILLDSLAHVLQYEYMPGDSSEEQIDRYTAKNLPDLLREPYFRREYWLQKNGVLARLYNGALGSADKGVGEGAEQEFEEDDLPQDLDGVDAGNKDVLRFYNQLQQRSQVRDAVLRVLNRHLSAAIQRMLNFTGEDLFELFLDLRRALYEEDKELVLLVEDVARQQGLSGAILESLIVRPHEIEGDPLCTLRSIVGITPEPFGLLAGNIRGKTTMVVDLDETAARERERMLLPMAARYLNAARLSEETLAEWHENNPTSPPPSKCTSCPFKAECHEAFGEVDGYGLYPFNRTALRQMYQRKDKDGFNPRVLLRDVLNWPLIQGKREVEKGEFPSPHLHQYFGGTQGWLPNDLNAVKRKDPTYGARRLALLDLWSTERRPVDLAEGIHTAFDLPPLGDTEVVEEEVESDKISEDQEDGVSQPPSSTGTEEGLSEADQQLSDALTTWANGEPIKMKRVNSIRKRVRSVVYHCIDWDGERLFRTELYGNSVFENYSINLKGQAGSTGTAEINIELPLEGQTRAEVAEGLQALLLYDHYGHWDFDGAPEKLVAYASLIEALADEVITQLRHPSGTDRPSWSPGIAAAEVLRLGARAAGEPRSSKTTLADRLDALFAPFPGEVDTPEAASSSWKTMQRKFAQRREGLLKLLKSYHICPKGGQASNWLLDSADLIDLLRRIDLKPRTTLPSDRGNLPKRLRPLHKPVTDPEGMLRSAVENEEERWTAWAERMAEYIGDPDDLEGTKAVVRKAFEDLERAGALRAKSDERQALDYHSRRIRTEDYHHLWVQAHIVAAREAEGELSMRLRELGYLNRKVLETTADGAMEYVAIAETILEKSVTWLQNQIGQVGGEDVEGLLATFRKTLGDLEQELTTPDVAAPGASMVETSDYGRGSDDVSTRAATVGEGFSEDRLSTRERAGSGASTGWPDEETSAGDVLEEGNAAEEPVPKLVVLSKQAHTLAVRYQEAQEVAGIAGKYRNLLEEYQSRLNQWTTLRESREALQAAGAELQTVMRGDDLAELARQQQDLIEESPKVYIEAKHNELRKEFLKRLDNLLSDRRTHTMEDWESYVEALAPPRNEEFLEVFRQIPQLEEAAEAVQQSFGVLEGFKQQLPEASIIEAAEKVANRIRSLLDDLMGGAGNDDGENLPVPVKRFLRAASEGRAPLESLTPEVEGWLRERDLMGSFAITVTSSD